MHFGYYPITIPKAVCYDSFIHLNWASFQVEQVQWVHKGKGCYTIMSGNVSQRAYKQKIVLYLWITLPYFKQVEWKGKQNNAEEWELQPE